MQVVFVFSFLALLAGGGQALECYSCTSKAPISGVSIAGTILNLLKKYPPCQEFDPANPQAKFVQQCPLLSNKGCMKVTDPNDSTNVMRSCFLVARNECKDSTCHCSTDKCNGADATAGTPLALLLAAALALVGGR